MGPDRLQSVRPPVGTGQAAKRPVSPIDPGSFADMLRAESAKAPQEVRMSQHAEARLREAGITLGREDMARIRGAMDKASAKGARESLLLMKDLALVVSIPNSTVITAVTGQRIRENVFTNIDSAVIVEGLDLSEGAQGILYQNRPPAQGGQTKL